MACLDQSPPFDPVYLFDQPLVEQTQSSIGEFEICAQKYVFRYMMKIVPSGYAVYFAVGTAVHKCFEYLLDPKHKKHDEVRRRTTCAKMIDDIFDKVVDSAAVAWMVNTDKLEMGRVQAHAIVEAWQVVAPTDDFKVLHTELTIRAKPGATIDSPILDRGAGKIDGIVELPDGELHLLEHKTRFSIRDLDFVQGLSLDHQALFYMALYRNWAMDAKNRKLVKVKKLPTGFFYDVIAKPQHKTHDTFDHWVERMKTAMLEAQDKYFLFQPVTVEASAVDRAVRNLEKIVARMDSLNPKNIEMNTKACNMYGGCPYRPLCSAGAEAGKPKALLTLPQLDMYTYAAEHLELNEETDE